MITTERMTIKEALPSEIDMIIDIESHPLNKDYLWVGTPEEHQDEIDDSCHLLLLFRDAATPTDWDPAAEGYALVPRDVKGYALIRLDEKSHRFEIRQIAITEKVYSDAGYDFNEFLKKCGTTREKLTEKTLGNASFGHLFLSILALTFNGLFASKMNSDLNSRQPFFSIRSSCFSETIKSLMVKGVVPRSLSSINTVAPEGSELIIISPYI